MNVPFCPFTVPLAGWQLVEASAGTGKTHAIVDLFVRALLEYRLSDQHLHISQILVLTYTRAATAELRVRVRRRLQNLLTQINTAAADAAPADTSQTWLRQFPPAAYATLRERIQLTLQEFDQAAIYTLHAFCQRVLSDQAFAARQALELQLEADESALLREIICDAWRTQMASSSLLYAQFLHQQGCSTPDDVLADLQKCLLHADLQFAAVDAVPGISTTVHAYRQYYLDLRALLHTAAETVLDFLRTQTSPKLKGNIISPAKLENFFAQLQLAVADTEPQWLNETLLELFSRTKISNTVKKTFAQDPPQHPLFDVCEHLLATQQTLSTQYTQQFQHWQQQLLTTVSNELAQRNQTQQRLTYGDMMRKLAAALQAQRQPPLAGELYRRYPLVLVDEFQDTDALQYRILQTIYPPPAPVFLVGDPKQAIYAFRGADVYAYLHARQQTQMPHSLSINHRATPKLVAAINALFARQPQAFVLEDLHFTPAHPLAGYAAGLLADSHLPALHCGFISREALGIGALRTHHNDGKPRQPPDYLTVNKAQALQISTDYVIRQLTQLLQQAPRLTDKNGHTRPLAGGDIAILVRSHQHAEHLRSALRRAGIAAVSRSQQSVFASSAAADLEWLARALRLPLHAPSIRAALATALMGYNAGTLHALLHDDARWEQETETFYQLARIAASDGLTAALRQALKKFAVAARLLAQEDGQRQLTNVMHLLDLLQQQAQQLHSTDLLIDWLHNKRYEVDRFLNHDADARCGNEDEQQRLENDEQLVQIVTVHASKGLQYPVLFCPLLWYAGEPRTRQTQPILYHDASHRARLAWRGDATQAGAAEQQVERETHAENVRLTYVALTRAQYRCYFTWGAITEAQRSGLAWLLHGEQRDPRFLSDTDLLAALTQTFNQQGTLLQIETLPGSAPPSAKAVPPATAPVPFSARSASRELHRAWHKESFSSLYHHHAAPADTADYDARVYTPIAAPASGSADDGETAATDIRWRFPRSGVAGQCLHSILQHADFQQGDKPAWGQLVHTQIQLAFSAHTAAHISTANVGDWLRAVIHTPLNRERLCLAQIAPPARRAELEFTFRARGGRDLWAYLRREQIVDSERLDARRLNGYLRGFIDLVFEHGGQYFIADYKSNWLGPAFADYASAALAPVMCAEGYQLQYWLYLLALHRLLKQRLPDYDYERHIGGVYYLFLRGMHTDFPQHGVFFARPAAAQVQQLDSLVTGPGT